MNILIAKLLKPFFKIRQSKIALNHTLTLKLGVTLVLNVTQVYEFFNPTKRLHHHLKIIQGSKFKFQKAYGKSGAAQAAPATPLSTAMTKAKINSGFLCPKIPSEAVSQHQIQKNFPGGACPPNPPPPPPSFCVHVNVCTQVLVPISRSNAICFHQA